MSSINLKIHLDEKTFDNVLQCSLDDNQTRGDLRLLLVNLFSNVANDFDLQFDRSDLINLPSVCTVEVSTFDKD